MDEGNLLNINKIVFSNASNIVKNEIDDDKIPYVKETRKESFNTVTTPINDQNDNTIKQKIKNGCCKDCMKAFSKSGKSCLCQVPANERKFSLSEKGCHVCGCHGCNPLDVRKRNRNDLRKKFLNDKEIMFKRQRIINSDDEDVLTNQKESDDYNKYRNDFERLLSEYVRNSQYFGLGFPLRTPTYILGYNPKCNDSITIEGKEFRKFKGNKYNNDENYRSRDKERSRDNSII